MLCFSSIGNSSHTYVNNNHNLYMYKNGANEFTHTYLLLYSLQSQIMVTLRCIYISTVIIIIIVKQRCKNTPLN